MSLTYKETKNAIPVAKISKTPKIIYLLPKSNVFKPVPETNLYEATFSCPYCKKDFNKKQTLIYHISKVCLKKSHHMDTMPSIQTPELLVKLPLDAHEMLFISGPPNSGKTYYTKEYVRMYKQMFKRNVIMFTRNEHDETLKDTEKLFNIVMIDPSILVDRFHLEDFNNSLVIFDDIESSEYPKVTEYLYSLMNDLIRNGRHNNTSVIVTNHDLRAGTKTKNLLNLMTCLVIFPQSGSVYHIKNTLKLYCGFSNPQTNKILQLPSRWVAISREAPQYITYEHGIYMVNADVY